MAERDYTLQEKEGNAAIDRMVHDLIRDVDALPLNRKAAAAVAMLMVGSRVMKEISEISDASAHEWVLSELQGIVRDSFNETDLSIPYEFIHGKDKA